MVNRLKENIEVEEKDEKYYEGSMANMSGCDGVGQTHECEHDQFAHNLLGSHEV